MGTSDDPLPRTLESRQQSRPRRPRPRLREPLGLHPSAGAPPDVQLVTYWGLGKAETELPAREMLADMLLDLRRPQEALTEYEMSLRTDLNRFNGLYSAAQAATQVQQKEKAGTYYTQLLKNCEGIRSDRPELAQAKTLLVSAGGM